MATNRTLTPSSPDYEDVRSNLRTFLRSQQIFRDFDFEGSNISALVNLLAYNDNLLGFWLNMVHSERMLDSVQLRDNAVSIAKDLNYTPRSSRSAQATLDVSFPATGFTLLEIPKGTQFTATNSNGTFNFVTAQTTTYRSPNSFFSVIGLDIFEGHYVNESFVVDSSDETQRFILSNPTIDTDSLTVVVNDGTGNSSYAKATSLYGIDGTSNVFFLQATSANTYEIEFGGGVLGRLPNDGSVVTATYRVCTGSTANECDTFFLDSDLAAFNGGVMGSPLVINTTSKSAGGAEPESIDSIRERAPRHYQTQEHAITTSDYETMVLENFPDVKSVSVYGGEDVTDTVQFGRVFVAVVTQSGGDLNQPRKDEIKALVEARNPFAIEPFVVSPEFLRLELEVVAHVNFRDTTLTNVQIRSLIDAGINQFDNDFLQRFNTTYRDSRFTDYVNNLDPAILSTETTVTIKKAAQIALNSGVALKIELNNEIEVGVRSTEFMMESKRWIVTDTISGVTNPGGILWLFEINLSNATPNFRVIGSIDYSSGLINTGALTVSDLLGSPGLVFRATPVSKDVFASRADVIEIDTDAGVEITVLDR